MIPPDILAAIVEHGRRDWPREACGFVLGFQGQLVHLPATNIQDQLHALNPTKFPRDSLSGFAVDPTTLLRVAVMAWAGWEPAVVYHSHPRDWWANFSRDDRLGALGGLAAPQFSDALYLVVSVRQSGEWMARGYRWHRERGFEPSHENFDITRQGF